MNFNQFYFESVWAPFHHLREITKSNIIIVVSSLSHQI